MLIFQKQCNLPMSNANFPMFLLIYSFDIKQNQLSREDPNRVISEAWTSK